MASIIQILNDELAQVGVRARAVFADGVLQLLCEAATPQLLEESSLVDQSEKFWNAFRPTIFAESTSTAACPRTPTAVARRN